MAIDKIQSESINLADNFDFTGTVSGAGGITEADQWRINSDLSISSGGTFTSNWERVDTDGFAKIGTGLTESSGVFSFPSTGIYNISYDFLAYANGGARTYFGVKIQTTVNNSSYSDAAISYDSAYTNTAYGNMSGNFLFDVTDVSTHKFKVLYETPGAIIFESDTSRSNNNVTVIRLGDT